MAKRDAGKRVWERPCEKRPCDCDGFLDAELSVHSKDCAWLRSLCNVSWLPSPTVTALRAAGVEVWRVWERGMTVPTWYARPGLEAVLRATGVWYLPGKVEPASGWVDLCRNLLSDSKADGMPEALDLLCYMGGRRGNKTKLDAAIHWRDRLSETLEPWDAPCKLRGALREQADASAKMLRKYRMENVQVSD